MRQPSLFLLVCALSIASGPFVKAADPLRDSVVKIHCTQRLPDFVRPWTKANPRQLSGSGVILDGKRILTNGHVVMYATRILVQANQSTERVPATVVAIAPGIDLALLKLDDETLFDTHPPLQIAAGFPRIKDTVNAYGYPMGGEQLSVTEGIISRIEYTGFAYNTLGLRIQVDAALNPGNSGGPAIAAGKIVGLVVSTIRNADNIGYLIAADEIRMFLQDVKDGKYDGKPKIRDFMQTVENRALRAKLGLKTGTGGLMITDVHTEDASYPLKRWDVITKIGDHPLDNQGNVKVDDELRLSFRYFVPKLVKDGHVPATLLRDGKVVKVDVPVYYGSDQLIPYLQGAYPPHFICGPLVFSSASQELLAGLGSRGQALLAARRSPVISRRFERRKQPDQQLVVLGARMFTDPMTEGYDDQIFAVVTHVNDVKIKNLAHLVTTIRDAKGKFIVFRLAGSYETIVFERDAMIQATEQILENEGIRYQMSSDLRDIWSPAK